MTRLEIYKKAMDVYGITGQTLMLAEECGELVQAANKLVRGTGDMRALIEELADVEIMCEQLMMYYGILHAEVDLLKFEKLRRLEKMLKSEGKSS